MTDARTIDAPGIYTIPAREYHADPCPFPSLSSSIAQRLCLNSPAHAREAHPRLNPEAVEEHCDEFDIGTVAHSLLLEGTANVAIVEAPDWRTKLAREARDAAYAAGVTPILEKHWPHIEAMVAAARAQLDRHSDGGAAMFVGGEAEQSAIWTDDGGIWCRARLDYFRETETGELAIDDYKTTSATANPDRWTRAMFQNGWDLQAAFYLRGVERLTGRPATFRYAVQETFPPYALAVISLGPDALVLAQKKILFALDAWRRGLESGRWDGYPRQTCYAALPPWHEAEWLEKELR